ncbi:glycosyltransferase family 39 protein [Fusobacterium sp.]|uniref:ArnT family glycosyltransferase n=1 Tax=Fusobacterium sp. TaxID=68766 RepID=UPI0025B9DC45|nr:glycosyltransferase family 39 protein [Fusobacterium sp.]
MKIKLKNYFYILGIYFFIGMPLAYLRFPDVRNELKYFIIVKNIAQEKNFLVLKYFSELYPDKPPLYFWLLRIGNLLSEEKFSFIAIVLGSLIPSILFTLLFYRFLKKFTEEKNALNMGIFLCTLPYFMGVSLFIRMDMLMNLFIFSSLYLFFSFYYFENSIKSVRLIIFYIFIFLAIFTKGIAGIAIPMIVILFFLIVEKDIKFLKKIAFIKGLLFILSLIGIWFYFVYKSPNGAEYISLLLGQETIGRIVKSKAHSREIYYYLIQMPLIFSPYILIVLGVFGYYLKKVKSYRQWDKLEKIGFSYLFPPLLILSLASGKLAIYLLPLFPGMVVLIYYVVLYNERERILKFLINVTIRINLFSYFLMKSKKIKGVLNIFVASNICILIVLLGGLKYYNNNYTLEPFVQIIKNIPEKVEAYKFNDYRNFEYFTNYKIDNYENISDISKGYYMVRNKYSSDIEKLNFKLIHKNKEYSLYKIEK